MSAAEKLSPAKLRDVRTLRGLSVRGLARVSGVSARTIRRVEEGHHQATSDVLEKLADALTRDDFEALALAEGIEPGTRAHLRDILPWELDPCAQYAVAHHPDGLTREQVAKLLGLCVRTVHMVEEEALQKLRAASVTLSEWLEARGPTSRTHDPSQKEAPPPTASCRC